MGIPVYFDPAHERHRPAWEWYRGERIPHVESPERARRILAALEARGGFDVRVPDPIDRGVIETVHTPELLDLYVAAEALPEGKAFYPSVFPRGITDPVGPIRVEHAGYYCFDTDTPLDRNTWTVARASAACAMAAAERVLSGDRLAYALSRPPGHHAAAGVFGGYCYINNAALVARALSARGRVALVDIDLHHGNGTQSIFWNDPGVFFGSVHGAPDDFYPHFDGHADETGGRAAPNSIVNVPLVRGTDGRGFLEGLGVVLGAVTAFAPWAIVVSAGFDTFKDDPIGGFRLEVSDFRSIAAAFAAVGKRIVVVQEGGYCLDALGEITRVFLGGLSEELSGGPLNS